MRDRMWGTRTRLVLVALVVTTTSRSVCATEEVVGAELGMRVGYAIPFGKIKDDASEFGVRGTFVATPSRAKRAPDDS